MSCAALIALGLHLASWHSAPGYNNANPGLYARSSCGLIEDSADLQDGVQIGTYYNSERAQTVYAAWVVDAQPFARARWFGLFGTAGLATGYRAHPVIPLVMGGITAQPADRLKLRLGYIPKAGKLNDTHVIHLALEWSL